MQIQANLLTLSLTSIVQLFSCVINEMGWRKSLVLFIKNTVLDGEGRERYYHPPLERMKLGNPFCPGRHLDVTWFNRDISICDKQNKERKRLVSEGFMVLRRR